MVLEEKKRATKLIEKLGIPIAKLGTNDDLLFGNDSVRQDDGTEVETTSAFFRDILDVLNDEVFCETEYSFRYILREAFASHASTSDTDEENVAVCQTETGHGDLSTVVKAMREYCQQHTRQSMHVVSI